MACRAYSKVAKPDRMMNLIWLFCSFDHAEKLQPVGARHGNVQDNQIDRCRLQKTKGLIDIGSLAGTFEAVLLPGNTEPDPLPDKVLVIDD